MNSTIELLYISCNLTRHARVKNILPVLGGRTIATRVNCILIPEGVCILLTYQGGHVLFFADFIFEFIFREF
jgi:hypothetical protein